MMNHDMEMFPALLALGEGNLPFTGWFPPQRANNMDILMFISFDDCLKNVLNKDWSPIAFRCHDTHVASM